MNIKTTIKSKSLVEEFGLNRTQRCIDLMLPEVRSLLNLSLEKKIKKTQKIISEALSNIKFIKMYSWIDHFEKRINDKKEAEILKVKKLYYYLLLNRLIMNFFPV